MENIQKKINYEFPITTAVYRKKQQIRKKYNYEVPIRTVVYRKKNSKSEKILVNFRLEQWYIGKKTTNQKASEALVYLLNMLMYLHNGALLANIL